MVILHIEQKIINLLGISKVLLLTHVLYIIIFIWTIKRVCGVMVSELDLSAVDCGFEPEFEEIKTKAVKLASAASPLNTQY